jgi:hypothetical protein
MEVASSDQKALRLLNKLLLAAQKAQIEGKHVALSKIINEANKLSSKLNDSIEKSTSSRTDSETASYRFVYGEVVE